MNQRCWQSWQSSKQLSSMPCAAWKKKNDQKISKTSKLHQTAEDKKKVRGTAVTSNCFLMDSPSSETAIEDSDPRREGSSPPTSSFSLGNLIKQKSVFFVRLVDVVGILCESVWILLVQVTKVQKKYIQESCSNESAVSQRYFDKILLTRYRVVERTSYDKGSPEACEGVTCWGLGSSYKSSVEKSAYSSNMKDYAKKDLEFQCLQYDGHSQSSLTGTQNKKKIPSIIHCAFHRSKTRPVLQRNDMLEENCKCSLLSVCSQRQSFTNHSCPRAEEIWYRKHSGTKLAKLKYRRG